jgi:hypothetical protein
MYYLPPELVDIILEYGGHIRHSMVGFRGIFDASKLFYSVYV